MRALNATALTLSLACGVHVAAEPERTPRRDTAREARSILARARAARVLPVRGLIDLTYDYSASWSAGSRGQLQIEVAAPDRIRWREMASWQDARTIEATVTARDVAYSFTDSRGTHAQSSAQVSRNIRAKSLTYWLLAANDFPSWAPPTFTHVGTAARDGIDLDEVRVQTDFIAVNLFFDRKSGLLRRLERKTQISGGQSVAGGSPPKASPVTEGVWAVRIGEYRAQGTSLFPGEFSSGLISGPPSAVGLTLVARLNGPAR